MDFKTSLVSLLAGIVLIGCSNQKNFSQKTNNFEDQTQVKEKQEKIYPIKMPKTLKGTQSYLYKKIKYTPEKGDYWNSAEKTIRLGHGDCEDIAILGAYFAEKLGYNPKILILIENMSYSHVITLLKEKTRLAGIKYGAIEKSDLFYPVYNSVDELIYDVNKIDHRNYSIYSICNLNKFTKDWRTSDKNLRNYKGKDFNDLKIVKKQKIK